jgi:hypothetical protein
MIMQIQLIFIVAAVLLSMPAAAATISFDLLNQTDTYYDEGSIESLDGSSSFSITRAGLTATISANIGILNQTGSAFGINAPLTGDATDQIDGDNGDEVVSVTFNQDIKLTLFEFHAIGSSDSGIITLPLGGTFAVDSVVDGLSTLILAGQSISIAHVTGNGFSFDSVTVETVPIPAAAWLFGSALLGLAGIARRKKA